MTRWIMLVLVMVGGCRAPPKAGPTPDDTAELPVAGCEEGAPVGLEVGLCAPDFSLPDADGVMTRLSSFRGKVALVDISAVW